MEISFSKFPMGIDCQEVPISVNRVRWRQHKFLSISEAGPWD